MQETALQFDSFTKKMWSHFSSFACNNVDCGLVQSEESEAAAFEKPINIKKSKNCQNFKPCFSWVLSHLPWFVMHHNKSNHVGYYHVQGIQGWCTYARNNKCLESYIRDETPCMWALSAFFGPSQAHHCTKTKVLHKCTGHPACRNCIHQKFEHTRGMKSIDFTVINTGTFWTL